MGLAACGSKSDEERTSKGTGPESSVQTAGDESNLNEGAGGTEASSDTQEAVQWLADIGQAE